MSMRLFMLALVGLLPGFLKVPIYRGVYGYSIGKRVRIGICILDCKSLVIGDDTTLRHGNAFIRCGEVAVGSHVRIGYLNLFRGGRRIALGDYSEALRLNVFNALDESDPGYEPPAELDIGYGTVITAGHRLDFTDSVRFGRCSILGGRNSSLWTHNRRTGKPVMVGDYCYLGSEIRMAPGARIPDCCVVGMGSVVTDAHPADESYSLIAGVPAQRKRALRADDMALIFGKTRFDLPDEPYPTPPGAVAGGNS